MSTVVETGLIGGTVATVSIRGKKLFRIRDVLLREGLDENMTSQVSVAFRKRFPSFTFVRVDRADTVRWGWYAEISAFKHLELFANDGDVQKAAKSSMFAAMTAGKVKKTERLKSELKEAFKALPLTEVIEAIDPSGTALVEIDHALNKRDEDNEALRLENERLKGFIRGMKARFTDGRYVVRVKAPTRLAAA